MEYLIVLARLEGDRGGKGYLDLVLGDVFGGTWGEEEVVVFSLLEEFTRFRELRRVVNTVGFIVGFRDEGGEIVHCL